MITKLLNKPTRALFLGLIILESIAFWVYLFPRWSALVWLAIVLITLLLSFKKLDWGLYIILAELFIGSHGHLLDWQVGGFNISLRLGLFVAVFIVMLYHWFKNRSQNILANLPRATWFLAIFIILGIGQGILKFGIAGSFFDWNAYLYFLLLPAFLLIKNKDFILNTTRILLVAVNWLFIKTYILLYIFAHDLQWLDLSLVYKFIRDTRIGEITYVNKNFWRIFMPAQIWTVIGLIAVVLILLLAKKNNWQIIDKWFLWVTLFTSSLTVLASFSRSNWLGAGLAIGLALIYLVFKKLITGRRFILASAGLILLLFLDVIFMFAWTGSWQPQLVSGRLTNLQEQAFDSRQAQLQPLWYQISENFLWGNGFGQTITYQSSDPRIKNEANPSGRYTTYALEWGYLDIWLKIGLFGLISYLAMIARVLYKKLNIRQNKPNFWVINQGLAWGLVALVVISIFSPYLNHPLGIGLILINLSHD